ncbi:glycosyltransferase family 2 protein [Mucilaginibacter sp.]|uniref:glycosyltransferase family 2 protein n=1 Tax=Mucilaginibacter sp. TaxID=1882438 RepID=UPI0035BC7E54
MEQSPLVSVIIPVFNSSIYIEACISSVLAQTWQNLEIIVVDDGSTDDSYEKAARFQHTKLRLIQQQNAGAGVARNTGLAASNGNYIQFLDADDFLSVDKIASQLAVMEGFSGYLGLCATIYFTDQEDPMRVEATEDWYKTGSHDPVDFLIKLYGGGGAQYGGMIQPNAWLTPRTVIDQAGLWTEERNPDDDGEFFCRILLASAGVRYAANGLNYYRKSTSSHRLSNRGSHQRSAAVLNSWISKAKHLAPFDHLSGVKKALSINFTELCYQNYPRFPDLSRKAFELALVYGGLAHPPYFGNKLFNLSRQLLPWRVLLQLQHIYHWTKKYLS